MELLGLTAFSVCVTQATLTVTYPALARKITNWLHKDGLNKLLRASRGFKDHFL